MALKNFMKSKALEGMAKGAAIGSVIPVAGTIIGGTIGGLTGLSKDLRSQYYGDEAAQYGFESYEDYMKRNRGIAKGAGKGAAIGTAIAPVVGTGIGAGIGAVAGTLKSRKGYSKFAEGKISEAIDRERLKRQQEEEAPYRKAIAEQRAAEEERQRALYGTTTTQPIVGGELPMYKKGGVANMVMINVEKGELAVDPRTMKVIMDFNDMPKHPKGKDVINQKGNVKVPVGTIIIPADMRRDFLKAEPGQRIEMAAELIERQREGEEKEMEENEGMEEQAMPQGMGMAQEQMPQGQGMMAMMGEEEEGGEEMERMQYGGLVGEEKIVAEGDTAFGYKKADKNNKDVYKRWEDKTLLKYPKADKEALKEFYQRNVTPVLTKDNKVDFVENMVWYKKIHGTEDKIENYPNKILINKLGELMKERKKSMSDSLNQESDYIKYGMGGYVKKYQNGTPGVITYDKPMNVPTYNEYMQIPEGTVDYGMLTSYYATNPPQQPQTAARTAGVSGGTTGGGLAGGLGTGLGMIGSAIPQYFLGRKQERESKRALEELQKQPTPKYKPSPELEQQKLDTAAARQRAKYGFSTEDVAAWNQRRMQQERSAFQRAKESGLSGAGQAVLGALSSQRIQAANEMAIQDARLREQKAQYADSSQRSLAQQYQRILDAQTIQDIQDRMRKEQAYGYSLRAGLENQYGAFSTAGAGLGYGLGAGIGSQIEQQREAGKSLTSLLGLFK